MELRELMNPLENLEELEGTEMLEISEVLEGEEELEVGEVQQCDEKRCVYLDNFGVDGVAMRRGGNKVGVVDLNGVDTGGLTFVSKSLGSF